METVQKVQKDISQPVYDTLDILAEAVLSFAYGKI